MSIENTSNMLQHERSGPWGARESAMIKTDSRTR